MVCDRKLLDDKHLAALPAARFLATFAPVQLITTEGVPMHSSTVNGIPTLGDAINTARMKAGLSDQDLAWAQGIRPSQWSRQLHGQGHIALDRLARAPLAFRVELIGQLEALWGVETTLETIHHDLVAMRAEMVKALTLSMARSGLALTGLNQVNRPLTGAARTETPGVPA